MVLLQFVILVNHRLQFRYAFLVEQVCNQMDAQEAIDICTELSDNVTERKFFKILIFRQHYLLIYFSLTAIHLILADCVLNGANISARQCFVEQDMELRDINSRLILARDHGRLNLCASEQVLPLLNFTNHVLLGCDFVILELVEQVDQLSVMVDLRVGWDRK